MPSTRYTLVTVAFAAVAAANGCGDDTDGPDAGAQLALCRVADRICDYEIGCPDNAGCNWCGCYLNGVPVGEVAACEQSKCRVDMTTGSIGARCTKTSDCDDGLKCVFDPGCTEPTGRCVRRDICMASGAGSGGSLMSQDPGMICDCANKTIAAVTRCGVEQPYLNVGACR